MSTARSVHNDIGSPMTALISRSYLIPAAHVAYHTEPPPMFSQWHLSTACAAPHCPAGHPRIKSEDKPLRAHGRAIACEGARQSTPTPPVFGSHLSPVRRGRETLGVKTSRATAYGGCRTIRDVSPPAYCAGSTPSPSASRTPLPLSGGEDRRPRRRRFNRHRHHPLPRVGGEVSRRSRDGEGVLPHRAGGAGYR